MPRRRAPQTNAEVHARVNEMQRNTEIEINLYSVAISVYDNSTLDGMIESLQIIKDQHPEQEEIKVAIAAGRWNPTIVFSGKREETDEEFEARKLKALKTGLTRLKSRQRKKARDLEKKRLEQRKQLKEIVEDLGPEIYEVFEEIKKN